MNKKEQEVVTEFLEKAKGQIGKEIEIIKRNGFIFDNLDDRWQKLAFTLYTDILSLATEAGHILEYLEEQD